MNLFSAILDVGRTTVAVEFWMQVFLWAPVTFDRDSWLAKKIDKSIEEAIAAKDILKGLR